MQKVIYDITPQVDLILSLRNSNMGWKRVFGELIDNALDAGANQVKVAARKGIFRIQDDGNGCGDFERMLTMGRHHKTGTTKLGRYGIGLKDAMFWAGDRIHIVTTTCEKRSEVRIDALEIIESREWKVSGQETIGAFDESGTLIELETDKRFRQIDDLIGELEFTFAPALSAGRQILINGRPLHPFEIPQLDHRVEAEGRISGKEYSVIAGVIPSGQENPSKGYNIAFEHRVICSTTEGTGEFNPSRFFAWVELGEGWRLTKHKDNLEDLEELCGALYMNCLPALEAAHSTGETLALDGMASSIEEAFAGLIREAKESRKKGETEGTNEPKQTARRRKKASKTRDGKGVFENVSNVRVSYAELANGLIGEVAVSEKVVKVTLASDHPMIREATSGGDERMLKYIAMTVLAAHFATNRQDAQRMLPGFEDAEAEMIFFNTISKWAERLASLTKGEAA